jgi:nicotinate-nucleotide--dimethylbenzimidazole phosphoribosyltransferase
LQFQTNIALLINESLSAEVARRWNSLTKPPGSLGRLEPLITQLALIQGQPVPRVQRQAMAVFCADHGVTAEGVSAYPREVTAQMVKNFVSGGAAVSVLCRHLGITPFIIDAGVDSEPEPGVVDLRIARGTANMTLEPAMTIPQTLRALNNGAELARQMRNDYDLAAVGEMGIGNTTAASALLCAFTGLTPERAVGPGTGLNPEGIARKTRAIAAAIARHKGTIETKYPIAILASVGGFEIATMAGFLLGAAEQRLPVIVDGFISSSAALTAAAIEPKVLNYLLFSHVSAEPAHRLMLNHLGVKPILDLDLRLGEGSGAALAFPLLGAAHALYTGMATFGEAGVSEG